MDILEKPGTERSELHLDNDFKRGRSLAPLFKSFLLLVKTGKL